MMDTTQKEQDETEKSNLRTSPCLGRNSLDGIITDPEYRKTFQSRVKGGNRMMAPLYKLRILPLFGLGKQIMLLTTRGRVSGQLRDTPIGYFRIDGLIHVLSGWEKGLTGIRICRPVPMKCFYRLAFAASGRG